MVPGTVKAISSASAKPCTDSLSRACACDLADPHVPPRGNLTPEVRDATVDDECAGAECCRRPGRAGGGGRVGRHHVHRLAEPLPRPVRRGRARRAGDRPSAVHDRRDERVHAAPAALATVAATVQETSGGRFVSASGAATPRCSISGAADASGAFPEPSPTADVPRRRDVDIDGLQSRIRWLDRAKAGQGAPRHRGVGTEGDRFAARTSGAHHVRGRRRSRAGGLGDRTRPRAAADAGREADADDSRSAHT